MLKEIDENVEHSMVNVAKEVYVSRILNQVYPDDATEDKAFQRYFTVVRYIDVNDIIAIGIIKQNGNFSSSLVGTFDIGWYSITNITIDNRRTFESRCVSNKLLTDDKKRLICASRQTTSIVLNGYVSAYVPDVVDVYESVIRDLLESHDPTIFSSGEYTRDPWFSHALVRIPATVIGPAWQHSLYSSPFIPKGFDTLPLESSVNLLLSYISPYFFRSNSKASIKTDSNGGYFNSNHYSSHLMRDPCGSLVYSPLLVQRYCENGITS